MEKDKILSMEEAALVAGGAKQDAAVLSGTVIEALPNAQLRVALSNGTTIVAHVSAKLRMSYTKFLPGDAVDVELPRHDTAMGRIVARHK